MFIYCNNFLNKKELCLATDVVLHNKGGRVHILT